VSNVIFPYLIGQGFPVQVEPVFSTIIQESTSGQETRLASYTFPRKKYTLTFSYLSDWNGQTAASDLATLQGFFTARLGSFDSFLFYQDNDSAVQSSIIGEGDGSTVQFQLYRQYGSGSEPVFDLNATGINSISIGGGGGTGYTSAPQVVFTGACTQPAQAIASVSGGHVDAIFIRFAGQGYETAPSVSFVGGGGSGASATAKLTPVIYLGGSVASGYTIGSTGIVTFGSPPGSGVQITADLAYYWRCRFQDDSITLSNDYEGFASCKKVVLYGTRQ